MVNAVGYPQKAPNLEWIEIPKAGGLTSHPILCPITLVERIIANDPARFEKTIRGGDGAIEAFWQHLKDNVIFTSIRDHIDTEHSVPVSIHGDAAPTTKVDGLYTISWSSPLGKGSTKETRYIYSVICQKDIADGTLEALFERLAWAFNALVAGRLPRRDWLGKKMEGAGRRLANGWKLAPIMLRGDWGFSRVCADFRHPLECPTCVGNAKRLRTKVTCVGPAAITERGGEKPYTPMSRT